MSRAFNVRECRILIDQHLVGGGKIWMVSAKTCKANITKIWKTCFIIHE